MYFLLGVKHSVPYGAGKGANEGSFSTLKYSGLEEKKTKRFRDRVPSKPKNYNKNCKGLKLVILLYSLFFIQGFGSISFSQITVWEQTLLDQNDNTMVCSFLNFYETNFYFRLYVLAYNLGTKIQMAVAKKTLPGMEEIHLPVLQIVKSGCSITFKAAKETQFP